MRRFRLVFFLFRITHAFVSVSAGVCSPKSTSYTRTQNPNFFWTYFRLTYAPVLASIAQKLKRDGLRCSGCFSVPTKRAQRANIQNCFCRLVSRWCRRGALATTWEAGATLQLPFKSKRTKTDKECVVPKMGNAREFTCTRRCSKRKPRLTSQHEDKNEKTHSRSFVKYSNMQRDLKTGCWIVLSREAFGLWLTISRNFP